MAKIIKYSFFLFIFLLPWQTRLIWQDAFLNGDVWEYGRLSLYGTEILLWFVLLAFFFWLVKNNKFSRVSFSEFLNRLKNPAAAGYWLVILLIFLAGTSIMWSADSQLAYYNWLHLAEAGAMLALILIMNFEFWQLAVCLAAAAAIQGLFGSWQFFSQSVFANKWLGLALHLPNSPGAVVLETASERWLRAYGSFPHPNILGGFLVIGWLLLFYLATLAKNRRQRILVLAALLLIVPALFFSFSRSAILALVLTIIFLGGWLYSRREKIALNIFIKISGITILIMVILTAIYWPIVAGRLFGGPRLEQVSITQRLDYTKQALRLISGNWLAGAGIGNYTLAVYQKINSTWPGFYYQPVHNIYLLIFTELGIFGLVIFGLIIGLIIWFSLKNIILVGAIREPHRQLEQAIVLLCLFVVLFIGLLDHYFWTLYSGIIIFWLILGLNLRNLMSRKS